MEGRGVSATTGTVGGLVVVPSVPGGIRGLIGVL